MSDDRCISPAAAAERASVSTDVVRRAIRAGRLPAFKIGSLVRIREEDFRAWAFGEPVVPDAQRRPRPTPTQPRRAPARGSLAALREIEQRRAS